MRAWLLIFLAASASLADGPPRLGVAPFKDDPAIAGLGRLVSAEIENGLAASRHLVVVNQAQQDEAARELGYQVGNAELYTDAARVKVGEWLGAQLLVIGDVARIGENIVVNARCLDLTTNALVPGVRSVQEGPEWRILATETAETLHGALTGGMALDPDAMSRRVRNDRSPVRLTTRFEAAGATPEADQWPTYYQGDSPKLEVSSTEAGYLLVLDIGSGGVFQLYPPCEGVSGGVTAQQTLTLPNAEYAKCGYDPAGFELTEANPGMEYVHTFFSRRPIRMTVPDPQRDANARPLTVSRYYEQFLPQLRAHLGELDPLWNGTSTAYYYGVDPALAAQPVRVAAAQEPVPVAEAATAPVAAAVDRGPAIRVEEAVGMAMLEGRTLEQARDLALLDAQRMALESGVGVMLQSSTRVDQYELLEDTIDLKSQTGFVRVDKILEEQQHDGAFWIKISAVVSVSPVISALAEHDELKELYAALERPRIACLIAEDAGGQTTDSGGVAETRLIEQLNARGLDVVDPAQLRALAERDRVRQALEGNAEAAQWLQAELGAEILIGGHAQAVAQQGAVGNRVMTDLNLKTIQASDGRVLTAMQRSFGPVAMAGGDATMVARQALSAAVDELLAPANGLGFVDGLVAEWISRPTELTIKVARADKAGLDRFRALLAPVPLELGDLKVDLAAGTGLRGRPALFSEVILSEFSTALSTVRVISPLRTSAAREHLIAAFEQLGWELTGFAGQRVDVTAKR